MPLAPLPPGYTVTQSLHPLLLLATKGDTTVANRLDPVIVFDIGASRLRAGVAIGPRLDMRVEYPTPRTAEGILSIIDRILSTFRDKGYWEDVVAISVATIGPLDMKTGEVVAAPNLGGIRIDLGRALSGYGKRVYIVNDCVAAVWGEYVFGLRHRYENIVYVTISTGIGGGVIVDGNLLLGKKGNAHEIGHIVVDSERKMRCGCGGWGHWEAYGGGANIPRFTRFLLETKYRGTKESSPLYSLVKTGRLTARELYTLAAGGDELASLIVDEINHYHVAGFESVVNVYDPEVVVVGGSIALNNWRLVVEPVAEKIKEGIVTTVPHIIPANFGDDEVLIGAAAIAYETPSSVLRIRERLNNHNHYRGVDG